MKKITPVIRTVIVMMFVVLMANSCEGLIEPAPQQTGCGSQMGCCPTTGCGRGWYGSSTQLCYNTANDCSKAGNSHCRQCY